MARDSYTLLQKNRKAYFNYEVVEDFECGISLEGTEVKSLRANRFSFGDAYVKIQNGSLFLVLSACQCIRACFDE